MAEYNFSVDDILAEVREQKKQEKPAERRPRPSVLTADEIKNMNGAAAKGASMDATVPEKAAPVAEEPKAEVVPKAHDEEPKAVHHIDEDEPMVEDATAVVFDYDNKPKEHTVVFEAVKTEAESSAEAEESTVVFEAVKTEAKENSPEINEGDGANDEKQGEQKYSDNERLNRFMNVSRESGFAGERARRQVDALFDDDQELNIDSRDVRKNPVALSAKEINSGREVASLVDEEDENEDSFTDYLPIKRAGKRAIRGGGFIDTAPQEERDENERTIDDYRDIDDAESVRADLDGKLSSLKRKRFFTFILTILQAALTILPALGLSLPSFLSPDTSAAAYVWVNLILFAVVVIINIKTFFRGIFSFFKLKPDVDSAVAVATLCSLAQLISFIVIPGAFAVSDCFYTAIVSFALYLNLAGKVAMFRRVRSNFELVATTGVKQSCFVVTGEDAHIITDGEHTGIAEITCSKKVLNLQNFIENSFYEDPCDKMATVLAPIGLAVSLLIFSAVYAITKNITTAISSAALVSTLFVPMTAMLSSNSAMMSACKKINENGGILAGYAAIEDFGDTEFVAVEAEDLFPAGCVELFNLRPLGDSSIDDTIMDAAALLREAGGPLYDVLVKMIQGRIKNLKDARSVVYTDGVGVCGKVGDDMIAIGNRKMAERLSDANLPDNEFEMKVRRSGAATVYIARNDRLCGMLVVKYTEKDEALGDSLNKLVRSGVRIAVKTSDANITDKLVESVFSLPEGSVMIMPSHSAEKYDAVCTPSTGGDSLMAHHNNIIGMAQAVRAAKKMKAAFVLAVVLSCVFVVLGAAVGIFMCISGGYAAATPVYVALFEIIGIMITLIIPSFVRI